jgi:hypothetical protein
MELSFWDSIKSSTNPEDFKAYLDQYPHGTFVVLARRRANAAPQAVASLPTQSLPARPAPATIAATKPVEPPKAAAAAAAAQVASIAPSLFGMGIDDPRYPKIGDLWEYTATDTTTKIVRKVRFEATAVSKDGIVESGGLVTAKPSTRAYAAGASLRYIGDLLQFSPYAVAFGTVKEGASWSSLIAEGDQFCVRPGVICRYDGKVAGREKISTPAGTFDALKVVIDFNGNFSNVRIWRQYTYWYSDETKRLVKSTARTLSGVSTQSDFEIELTSFVPASQRTPGSGGVQLASVASGGVLGSGIDDPKYPRIGDYWVYKYVDTTTKLEKKARIEIADVSKEGIVETSDLGGDDSFQREYKAPAQIVWNRLWHEFSPYVQSFEALQSTKAWNSLPADAIASCRQPGANCRLEGRVVGVEQVSTAAGTFEATKVVFDLYGILNNRGSASGSALGWRELTYWYSKQVKRVIKVTSRTRRGVTIDPDYDVEMVSYKLN